MTLAYVYRSGQLEFGDEMPENARLLDEGEGLKWRKAIEIKCRRAYDSETFLVPGVPEAATDDDARRAIERFRGWLSAGKARDAGGHGTHSR